MRNISSAFSRALMADKRDYKNRLYVTLANGFEFIIDNARIWEDGVRIQDAVSADNVFQIGAAIINQATFVINNIYGDYDEYSFDGARIIAYTGMTDLDDGTTEYIKLGTFEVDETTYNGSLITLTCLDYMSRFDRAYTFDNPGDWTITYPNTLEQIVLNACHNCNVTLDSLSLNFPHKNYIVTTMPSGENTTYRQVISWAAQIACCYARCNADGKLEIKWYATEEFDKMSDWIDGGVFDGIKDIEWLDDYLNTEDGMTSISSEQADNQWFRINNSIGFPFNGYTADYVYIDTDSCYAFSDLQPSSHGHTSLKDINICTRDGQSISIKYQEISTYGKNAIKIRFNGYTNVSHQTREYALEYEIFFTEDREIIVNFITLPTNTSYRGISSVIENTVSTTITPTTESLIAFYRNDKNKWEGGSISGAYFTGDTADGGSFEPWNTGDVYDGGVFKDRSNIHFITSSYSSSVSTDDVVVTGVKVIKKIKEEGQSDSFIEYMCGSTGYVVVIKDNDFVDGIHGQDIADWIGAKVNGLKFRKASLTHPSDPSIEAGDVALYFDLKGYVYPVLVSSTTFCPGDSQQTVSSAETPTRNSAQKFSEATRNYVEVRKQLKQQKDSLVDQIAHASGLYYTEVADPTGGSKIYYHNKSELADSDIVMLFSTTGFTLTANYQDLHPTWYGMTVDGTMIASILNTTGVNADWINTGTITIGGTTGNKNGSLIIKDASGTTIGTFNKNGISVKGSIQSGSSISGASITGSSVAIGGSGVAGSLVVKDSSNNTLASMSSSGVSVKGTITAQSLTANDYVHVDGNSNSYLNIPMGNANCYTRVSEQGFFVRDNNSNEVVISTNASYGAGLTVRPKNYSSFTQGASIDRNSITINQYKSPNYPSLTLTDNQIVLARIVGSNAQLIFEAYSESSAGASGYGVNIYGNFEVKGGTKKRIVETENYSVRGLTCYEMPSPMFGDIGEGVIGDDGLCYVSLDPIFLETISNQFAYQVFLQKYGIGECYVSERKPTYFVVAGEPNLSFAWEIKARQVDFDQERLPRREERMEPKTIDYADEAIKHIKEIAEERSIEND